MAVPAVGSDSVFTVAKETTYGVTPTTPTGTIIGFNSDSVRANQNLLDNAQISADPNFRDSVRGKKDAGGNISMNLTVTSAPMIFEMITGQRATTGASDPYTHVSKILAGTLPSYVLEKQISPGGTDRFILVNGLVADTLKLSASAEGFLTADLGFIASNITDGASTAFNTPQDLSGGTPFEHMMLAAADVEIGGSDFGGILEFTLDVNNNLYKDDYRVGGTGSRHSVTRGRTKVSGSIKAMYDSATLYSILTGTSPSSIKLKWIAAANRSIEISLPRVIFERTDPAVENDGPVMLSANFNAVYDGTATSSLVVTMVNDQAGTVYTLD